jgi:hypothetical protein
MAAHSISNNETTKWAKFGLFFSRLLIASAVTFVLASAFHTQAVLAGLISVGADIPLSLRLQTVLDDLLGLLPTYGIIVFIGMLIAMSVANYLSKALTKRWQVKSTLWLFALAGATAIFSILAAMHPILDVTIIAGARGMAGLLTQSIAGAIGGCVFAVLRRYF